MGGLPMRAFRAPVTISSEAQEFINTTSVESPTPITLDNIQEIRTSVSKDFLPSVRNVQARYRPDVVESSFADVPVQIVRAGDSVVNNDSVILYFFGGGFVTGDPTTDQLITAPLAHMTGATVYAPHYRLAPEHPYPAALDDGF